MQKQTITKDDGRYLIYYTFPEGDDDEDTAPETPGAPSAQRQVASEDVAEEDAPPAPQGE